MMSRSLITTNGDNMKPIHPGRILKREMEARGLSANRLALALRVSPGRISQILSERRRLSPDTAMRLSLYFGNSPHFWMNLQTRYDLTLVENEAGFRIRTEVAQAL